MDAAAARVLVTGWQAARSGAALHRTGCSHNRRTLSRQADRQTGRQPHPIQQGCHEGCVVGGLVVEAVARHTAEYARQQRLLHQQALLRAHRRDSHLGPDTKSAAGQDHHPPHVPCSPDSAQCTLGQRCTGRRSSVLTILTATWGQAPGQQLDRTRGSPGGWIAQSSAACCQGRL